MIIRTSAGQLFFVVELADEHLAHCWNGYAVRRVRGGAYVRKENAKPMLVRKLGCEIVERDVLAPWQSLDA